MRLSSSAVEHLFCKQAVVGSNPTSGSDVGGAPCGFPAHLIAYRASFSRTRMSQDNLIKMECTECHRVNYFSRKNKKMIKERLELKKFCRWCKKHQKHKETK